MRKKPTVFVVADLASADAALARLLEIKRAVDAEETRMNAAVDQLKAHAKECTAAIRAEATAIEAALATFAGARKPDLFTKARSQELTFGTIGFRRSTEVKPKPKGTWGAILERIKALCTGKDGDPFKAAIRVKEEANKDVMKDWPEERLETVGARIVPKDVFYYELNAEEIKGEAA